MEAPNNIGITLFTEASSHSQRIAKDICSRNVKINFISVSLKVPEFRFPEFSVQMMEKGINPKVIDDTGYSQIDDFPSRFENEQSAEFLSNFKNSIHFSIEDISCDRNCPENCSSKFRKFFSKEGQLVNMIESNQIGRGGFGSVFQVQFHGKEMAAKCVEIGQWKETSSLDEAKSNFENEIQEYIIQNAIPGSGIINPSAMIRQQNQSQDEDGEWFARNYNIFIYPKYDCNLYELKVNRRGDFTEELLTKIINQCIVRQIL